MLAWPSLGAGAAPVGWSWIHVGVPPTLLALASTHTSLTQGDDLPKPPPKTIMRSVPASYAAVWRTLGAGGLPDGVTCAHVGVPTPLAFVRAHTSLKLFGPVLRPPKTII